MITIAALTALGREPELKAHIRGGLNVGLSREQIVEIIMQMAFYAGQPAAHAGFRAAKEVFDQVDGREPVARRAKTARSCQGPSMADTRPAIPGTHAVRSFGPRGAEPHLWSRACLEPFRRGHGSRSPQGRGLR